MNWIEVNGTSLRYELSGSGPTTLVLIHEMGGTLDSWDQGLGALNNSRQVLRYDTRGAGLSEKIGGTVTCSDMADDLKALLGRKFGTSDGVDARPQRRRGLLERFEFERDIVVLVVLACEAQASALHAQFK